MERNTRRGHGLHTDRSWCSNSVLRNLSRTRNKQHHKLHKNNRNPIFNYVGFCIYAIIALGCLPAKAEPTANQTAVASPTAVSSGSAVNQAVQVVNSQYFQQSYGNGIQCQGTTLVVAPFAIAGLQAPDFETSNDFGLSLQVSMPLDQSAVRLCKEAVQTQIARQQAETDKAQLDYQLVRALKCTELIQQGAFLHPSSPYAGLCADVIAVGSDGVLRTGTGQVVAVAANQDTQRPSSPEPSSKPSLSEVSLSSAPDQTEVSQTPRQQ